MLYPELLGLAQVPDGDPVTQNASEAQALQNLIFGSFRSDIVETLRKRVYRSNDPRARKLCVLHDSGGEMGTGLIDTYLSARIATYGVKGHNRRTRMTLSFLENKLIESHRNMNKRTYFRFLWDKEHAIGCKVVRHVLPSGMDAGSFYMFGQEFSVLDSGVLRAGDTITDQHTEWMTSEHFDEAANLTLTITDRIRETADYRMFRELDISQ